MRVNRAQTEISVASHISIRRLPQHWKSVGPFWQPLKNTVVSPSVTSDNCQVVLRSCPFRAADHTVWGTKLTCRWSEDRNRPHSSWSWQINTASHTQKFFSLCTVLVHPRKSPPFPQTSSSNHVSIHHNGWRKIKWFVSIGINLRNWFMDVLIPRCF